MMKKLFFFALLMLAILSSCKKKATPETATDMAKMSEDFRSFYEKFHSDSAFQHNHIRFPLQGLPSDVDSATLADKDFYYTADIWKNHQPVDFSKGEFTQSVEALGDRMIVERIYKSDNSYAIERRFARLSDNEWYLIYYIAPNKFSKIQQ